MEKKMTLKDGSVLIKTDEGVYFHSLDSQSIPLLIDKEEGESLEMTYTKGGLI